MRHLHVPAGFWLCCGVLLLLASIAAAQPDAANPTAKQQPQAGGENRETAKTDAAKTPAATIPDAAHQPVLTTHSVTIAGQRVSYTAEAGMLPLLTPEGGLRASVFYVAYLKQGDDHPDRRPLTFCFNGGPGSSSVWLHLGALGPRRVRLNETDVTKQVPFGLSDNQFSILDASDLVFIDPVGTGYSQPGKKEKAEQFFGDLSDIQSVGGFIQLWTTRHQRWLSPKYLCGESYGVFRAAGLARQLHAHYGMTMNGLIFISGLLDGDVPTCQISLPAYTATAHYHKKLPPDLQADLPKALAEAREFMRGEYASVLFQGTSLPPRQRVRVVAKLARLTGLSARVIEDNDLCVEPSTFCVELLRDRGLVVGRHDGRITGHESAAGRGTADSTPRYPGSTAPFPPP